MSCAAVAAALWLASGYAKDVSGSNDHPALSRIAGSTIAMYERKDQAEIRIPLERVIFDLQTQKFNAFKTISASGRLTRITGDFESNRNLSQRRAESVANALVTGFGIAPDRLVPFGVSYAAPVASNATAEGRSQNRRVELVRY